MWRIVFTSVCVALTVLSGRASGQEFLRFSPPTNWEVAQQAGNPAQRVVELVPQGQKIDKWTELLTVHTYNLQGGKWPATVEDAMRAQQEAIAKRCPSVRWNIIARSEAAILYEWRIADCPPEADQHEIAKFLDGSTNRFRVAYTAKVKELSKEKRAEWLQYVAETQIITR